MTPLPAWSVIIVGAGPVGLLLGNLLGARGIRTLLIDKRPRGPEASMAIGLTPPSLAILGTLGLDAPFIAAGVRVDQAVIHGDRRRLGALSFRDLPPPYPFILSLPQAQTVTLLEARLRDWPTVELRRSTELLDLRQGRSGVTVMLRKVGTQAVDQLHCAFLVGADGGKGCVRPLAGIAAAAGSYPQNFAMADFTDHSGLGNQAHLFFTRGGSVEAFPLPRGRRRWIVQAPRLFDPVPPGFLTETVRQRTGVSLRDDDQHFTSAFAVGWLLAEHYHCGRVALCGDAAHLMSPIGGQGMNVGFGDAGRLAIALERSLRQGGDAATDLTAYHADRRPAAAAAIARAARGMAFGTRRGQLTGLWRPLVIKLLLSPPWRVRLPPYFAMLTLPGRTVPVAPGGDR